MDSRVRGNDREENTEIFAPGGGNIEEIFTPGVVQICHSYSRFSVIFALGVVQYFYKGGSNLDP